MKGFWGWRDKRPAVGLGACGWFCRFLPDGTCLVATALSSFSQAIPTVQALASLPDTPESAP